MAFTKKLATVSALPWAFLIAGAALYGASAMPGLAIMDSGEFLGVAVKLGVAHPTGYPLYAVLGHLATFFPWGDAAWRINLLSAAGAAGTVFFLALAAAETARAAGWTGLNRGAAVAVAGASALVGKTLWELGTLAEVYALNALFWAALLWLALRLRRTGEARDLHVMAFVAGLALSNHLTIALFFPFTVVIAWPGRAKARALALALPFAAALFVAALAVNLYTPLRAIREPLYNWNQPSTLGALSKHLSGFQYRGNVGEKGWTGFTNAARAFRAVFVYNAVPAVLFAPVAFWAGTRARALGRVVWTLLAYGTLYYIYCAVYAIPDIIYYYVPFYLVFSLLGAAAIGVILTWAQGRSGKKARRALTAAVIAVMGAGVIWAGAANLPHGYRRNFIFAEEYGDRVLAALPARALFFPSGDTNTFVTWYNVYARGRRPDVAVIDQLRLTGRGYLTFLGRLHPDLELPTEADFQLLMDMAIARGEVPEGGIVFNYSDDFILPEVMSEIIADNEGNRPIYWGLGDSATRLRKYIIPYNIVMAVTTNPPEPAVLETRADATVKALTDLMSFVRARDPREFDDLFFQQTGFIYYRCLSDFLTAWGIINPQFKLMASYIDNFPSDATGYFNLGSLYFFAQQPAEAIPYLRRAAEINPSDNLTQVRLAQALVGTGRRREAEAIAAALKSRKRGEADYCRGIIYRECGLYDNSLASFAAAAPYYGDDAKFWVDFGYARDAAGDARGAVAAFGKAVALDPGEPYVLDARGMSYLRLNDLAAAAADFEAALALKPTDARAHYNLACIAARQNSPSQAFYHLEAALEANPARYAALAAEDADFASLRETPQFQELLARRRP